jgi:hypothetical protein
MLRCPGGLVWQVPYRKNAQGGQKNFISSPAQLSQDSNIFSPRDSRLRLDVFPVVLRHFVEVRILGPQISLQSPTIRSAFA